MNKQTTNVKGSNVPGLTRSKTALADRSHALAPHSCVKHQTTSPPAVNPATLFLVQDVLNSPGQPLDRGSRSFLERSFGPDFSQVRAHPASPRLLNFGSCSDRQEHEAEHFAESALHESVNAKGETAVSEKNHRADLSGVRIHTEQRASESARAIGALAYTAGNHIVFSSGQYAPRTGSGKRLLFHELAHVGQQSRASSEVLTVRRYTAFDSGAQTTGASLGWKHPGGSALRVADDGQIAVEDNGWGPGTSKRAWTVPSKVAESNKILSGQGSVAQLQSKSGGQEISGHAPDSNQAVTLQEIEPVKSGGGPLNLASDCGTACRQVMGSGPAGSKDVAVIKGGSQQPSGKLGGWLGGSAGLLAGGAAGAGIGLLAGGVPGAVIGGAIGAIGGLIGGALAGSAIQKKLSNKPSAAGEEHLTARAYHGGNPTTPEEWSEELFKKEFGADLTREQAYAAYAKLSPEEKDAFDRKYGINKYAAPRVGQGLTIGTEKDMPGFAPASSFTWNFHYAADVLSSGPDYVTLESAAGWDPTEWIFFMYGPESKGQSFHEFQGATASHGTKYSTFVVEPEK